MKKQFLLLSFVSLLLVSIPALAARTIQVTIDGQTFQCGPNNGGSNPPVSCTSECQGEYQVEEVVNGRWQNVTRCGYTSTCELQSNGCFKKVGCTKFDQIDEVVNGRWQEILKCSVTSTSYTCP
jgi:hypothetical protein